MAPGLPKGSPFCLESGLAVDRCVLLVDAGYLFAQGGLAVCGTKARHELSLDASRIIGGLSDFVTSHAGLPLLRTYWYDGAQQGIPTAEHQRIAQVPYVKLRMGRINGTGQQKGVDALIYRDLMTLATERAATDAYLLSGDDDLREGVIYAQDRGMRVTLLGIANQRKTNQSQELRYEVDDRLIVNEALLKSVFSRVPQQPQLPLVADNAPTAELTPSATGSEYAREWLAQATDDARAALLEGRPTIPGTLDIDLLRSAERRLGRSLRGDDATKRKVRSGFWNAITDAKSEATSMPDSNEVADGEANRADA